MKIRSFPTEKWKKVSTPEPTKRNSYYISNHGRIKSKNKISGDEALLKGSVARGNLNTINLKLINNTPHTVYVHNFVGRHFVAKGGRDKEFVIHKDLNRSNNAFTNLQWVTRKELTEFQLKNGIYKSQNKKRGSNQKLTVTKVKLIKSRLKSGRTKKKVIARSFGITMTQLNRIIKGENWGYVTI